MKKLYITASLILFAFIAYTQKEKEADSLAVKQFLQEIHNAYDQAGKLSFKVEYKYANKSQPGNYIDTLSGNISMDKKRVHFAIGGTETIINSKYTIKVLPDEQLIYLDKSQHESYMDPVSIMNAILVKAAGGHASVIKGKETSTMYIDYPEGNMIRHISMTIDKHTGFFRKVIYDIYTTNLVGEEQVSQPGQAAPYEKEGKVEVIFSNYQKGSFNDLLFDETKYFKRLGNNFEASDLYNGYRVFVASSNL